MQRQPSLQATSTLGNTLNPCIGSYIGKLYTFNPALAGTNGKQCLNEAKVRVRFSQGRRH